MSTIHDLPRHGVDLQSWLLDQRRAGRLGEVFTQASDAEVSAVLEATDGRRCVRFHHVREFAYPLVGNTLNSRADVATALHGPPETSTGDVVRAALDRPRPTITVPARCAPVLDQTSSPADLLSRLPIIRQHEHDAGPYLTSGVLVTRDPRTGHSDLSINRLQWTGGAQLRTLVLPGRLARILSTAEEEGRDLEVAIVVGNHPAVTLASQSPPWSHLDDLHVAAALAGGLDVVATPGSGLPVPAAAQIVLEGRFRCRWRAAEGPFGEFPRTYGPKAPAPVIDLFAAHHRDDAIYQSIQSGSREHFLLGGVMREVQVLLALEQAGLPVSAVRLPESGSCRLQAAVALAPGATRDQGETACRITFETVRSIKQVLVVDADVDVHDDEQLGWALATRVRADRDLVLVSGDGSSLDPTSTNGAVTKVGVLALVGDDSRHARMMAGPVPTRRLAALLDEADAPSPAGLPDLIGCGR